MKKRRLIALLLTGAMVMTVAGCGSKESTTSTADTSKTETSKTESSGDAADAEVAEDEFAWLNTSGLPIVAEGTEKKLSIAVCMGTDSAENPEDVWMYDFITQGMNIDVELTKFTSDNRDEFLSLTFASNELPDIIIGGSFSTAKLLEYGAEEGQIIDIAPYITEDFMPNLTAVYEQFPEYKTTISDTEGHIWSLGNISPPDNNQAVNRAFLNYDLIESVGKEVPTTLDELTDVMKAIKDSDPEMYPLGGSIASNNPMGYILNAFGYLTTNAQGLRMAIRDGEAVLPVADREAYGEVLKYMNMCYEEGYIHPDFFTMDSSTTTAIMTEGHNAFYNQAPFVYLDTFGEWWGALPLTSEYNATAQWPVSMDKISSGSVVITSACEEPELAAAFLDFFYKPADDIQHSQQFLQQTGPNLDVWGDYLYDNGGWTIDETTGIRTYNDMVNNPEKYNSVGEYSSMACTLWGYGVFGCTYTTDYSKDYEEERPGVAEIMAQYENPADARHALTEGQYHFETALKTTVCEYATTEVFPTTVFFDAETSEELANIQVVLEDYAKTETAKFITGARPLDEIDAYFDEMERLGATEYVQTYADYYATMK